MFSDENEYIRDDDEWADELNLVSRFTECVINKHENSFFDSDDLMVIIEHFIQDENIDKARQAVNYAYNFFPSDPDIMLKDAKVNLAEGHFDKAYKLLQEGRMGGDEIEYYFTLGQYHALSNNHDKAINAYLQALSLTDDPYEKSNINYGLASQYMATEQYDKAIACLKKSAINADPVHREIIFLDLRHCYQYSNRLDEAIKYFNEYIDKDPNCLAAWNSLADCYRKLEQYDEAIEYYEYALAINPIDVYANINLTNIYYDTEQYQKAIDTINDAMENGMAETNDTDTIVADCLYNLDKPAEAERLYRRALLFNPDDINAWSGLGFIYSDAHCYNKAILYLQKGVGHIQDENCLEVLLTLAEAYEKNGDTNEAIETLERIIGQWAADPSAYCILAKLHITKKEFQKALDILSTGLTKTDFNSSIEYFMAYFMLLINNREEGLYYLEMALQDDVESFQEFINLDPSLLGNDAEVIEMIGKYRSIPQQ